MVDIVIVDDQPYLCELFPHACMGNDEVRITCAHDAESVKRCLADSKADVVFLEMCLHGFEAWEVHHYIKTENPHLPVLSLPPMMTTRMILGSGG
jgi:DNA-binding NtrC family response regulator